MYVLKRSAGKVAVCRNCYRHIIFSHYIWKIRIFCRTSYRLAAVDIYICIGDRAVAVVVEKVERHLVVTIPYQSIIFAIGIIAPVKLYRRLNCVHLVCKGDFTYTIIIVVISEEICLRILSERYCNSIYASIRNSNAAVV